MLCQNEQEFQRNTRRACSFDSVFKKIISHAVNNLFVPIFAFSQDRSAFFSFFKLKKKVVSDDSVWDFYLLFNRLYV